MTSTVAVLWSVDIIILVCARHTRTTPTLLTPATPQSSAELDLLDVSIIIPALNEGEVVARAIQSAWQAGAGEVILADGGSSDGTREIAQSQSCQVIQCQTGRAIQMNTGARAASGDVILFLHADTWLAAGAVEQIIAALADDRALGGAFAQQIEAPGRVFRWLERGNAWRVRRQGLPYGDQGIFLRRDVFFDLGGFPEVKLMEDLLLMKKLRRRARPILLAGPLHVSARRWKRHGPLRQTLRNFVLLSANRFGISPNWLAGLYQRHDAPES